MFGACAVSWHREMPGPKFWGLLFINDTGSVRRAQCDTGSQISLLPASRIDKLGGGHGPTSPLLAEFPELMEPTFSASTNKHGVEHHISYHLPTGLRLGGASTRIDSP